MRTPIDEQLMQQAAHYSLRYCCDCCAHFDPSADHCSLGYPPQPRRTAPLRPGEFLEFCKEFDLA